MRTIGSDDRRHEAAAGRTTAPTTRNALLDCFIVGLAGAILAAAWHGHFIKPHYDFYEFHEVGAALLRGEMPPTFKRGPVYSLLIAGIGESFRAVGFGGDFAPWVAAKSLNTAAMGANAGLICLILLHWRVPGARWWAFSAACLPWGIYCSAQGIAEPLIVLFMLLSLHGIQRSSAGGAVFAALAALTRYDVAGLIAGLVVAGARRDQRLSRALLIGSCATFPLLLWLILTLVTFPTRGEEHYLAQMIERPQFDLRWSVQSGFRALLDEREAPAPPLLRAFGLPIGGIVWSLVAGLSLIGVANGVKRNDGAVLCAACAWVGYVLVHASFPFQIDRFGYPPAILLLLLTGHGVGALRDVTSDWITTQFVRNTLLMVCILFCGGLALSEWTTIAWLSTSDAQRIAVLSVLLTACAGLVAGCGALQTRAGWMTLSAACMTAVFVHVQTRATVPMLRSGREYAGVVEAARWIRANAEPGTRVLSSESGLYRMMMPESPRSRFVGYEAIRAEKFEDILAELRQTGIRYIVWHARHLDLHDRYYYDRWGLGRFEILGTNESPAGLEIVYRHAQNPPLAILRIRDSQTGE